MTSPLYYDNPGLLEFDATVLATHDHDEHTDVVLDRTAFYPEGGSQPADHGVIAGHPVVDVQTNGGTITHVVHGTLPRHVIGTRVAAKVDAARRRDYCQQHTGQHVLSGAFMAVGDYPTVSVHQGEDYTTIEIAAASIARADLDAVEQRAHEVIEADMPVTARWATDQTIGEFALRRPPKVSGSIRVIQIGGFDSVACGGLHLARTGQIRLVRLLSVETIRGNTRTAWKIGDRAVAHYQETSDIVAQLSTDLSARPSELSERLERLDQRLKAAEIDNGRLRDRIYLLEARTLLGNAELHRGVHVVTAEYSGESKDFLRGVVERLVASADVAACLVNRMGTQVQWCIGISAASAVGFDAVRAELLPIIDAKGGGRAPIWQGIGRRAAHAEAFLAAFQSIAVS